MTTTIAVKLNNKIVFASDSAVSNYGRIWMMKEGKFHKTNDGIVIGNAGSMREKQVVEFGLTMPTLQHAETADHYMYRVANAIKEAFLERKTNKDDENCNGSMILSYQGKLYYFGSDFQITEFSGYFEAVGSGQYYAIGAMSVMIENGETDPLKVATKAVETAIKYDPWTVGPVHTLEIECPVESE
jgi:ATP-dependent protease HslVU (ClpYQ) peptidase subunit